MPMRTPQFLKGNYSYTLLDAARRSSATSRRARAAYTTVALLAFVGVVHLTVIVCGRLSLEFKAYNGATVSAYNGATVPAYDTATVPAHDTTATAPAYDATAPASVNHDVTVSRENGSLIDLGEIAEERYNLGIVPGEEGTTRFFKRLENFAQTLPPIVAREFVASLIRHLPPSHGGLIKEGIDKGELQHQHPAMVSYKNIFQTDKNTPGELSAEWQNMNAPDDWELRYFNDEQLESWVRDTFAFKREEEEGSREQESSVTWAWSYMKHSVLKADFWRYLVTMAEGGVYADADTKPLQRIETWGNLDVETRDISETDGADWRAKQATYPSIMIGVETDVRRYADWHKYWPRPVGVCQWAFASAPYHPILMEAVRKVVNGTAYVAEHEGNVVPEGVLGPDVEDIEEDTGDNSRDEYRPPQARKRKNDKALSVIEWTGPGAFSDAVFAYMLARYGVTWHELRGRNTPTRIGEVVFLPITAFANGGFADFGDEGVESPQALLHHQLRGSWKVNGWW